LNQYGENVNKIKRPYRICLDQELCTLLELMMKERMRDKEPIDDDSWLFRSYCTRGVRFRKVAKSQRGDALHKCNINELVKDIAERAGLQRYIPMRIGRKKAEIHAHSFRPYFNMRLQEAGVDREMIRFLMGQKLPYGDRAHADAYSKYTPEIIRKMWMMKGCDGVLSLTGAATQAQDIARWLEMAKEFGLDMEEAYALWRGAGSYDKAVRLLRERIEREITFHLQSGGLAYRVKQRQIIVKESELEKLLEDGAEVVTVLPSGKIVVRARA